MLFFPCFGKNVVFTHLGHGMISFLWVSITCRSLLLFETNFVSHMPHFKSIFSEFVYDKALGVLSPMLGDSSLSEVLLCGFFWYDCLFRSLTKSLLSFCHCASFVFLLSKAFCFKASISCLVYNDLHGLLVRTR